MRRGFFGRGLAALAVAAAMLPRAFAATLERQARKREDAGAPAPRPVKRHRTSTGRRRPPAGSAAAEALLLRAVEKRERRRARNWVNARRGGFGVHGVAQSALAMWSRLAG